MSGIRGRLAKGAAWVAGARVFISLVSFLSTLILARLLTPADFGLVALATTILAIISAVTDLSLSQALIQHPEPTDDHFHTAFTLNLVRASVIAMGFAAAAWPVAEAYRESRLVEVMLVLAGSVLLSGFTNPKTVVFSRELDFSQEFVLTVAQKVAGFTASIAVAFIYRSYWALVVGAVATQLIAIVVSYLLIPYRPKLALRHAPDLWSFSVWLTLGQILNTINWKFDYLLIGKVTGRTALGYYSVGDNLATLPTREATAPITRVLFPGLSRVAHDRERVQQGYVSAQALLTSVALPVGVGFALCARSIVLLAMGEKWLPVVPIIQGLSAIFALQTLGTLVQPLAMAKGATRQLFMRDAMSFAVRLPLIVTGLLMGGLPGVIAARMASGVIAIGFNLFLVRSLIGVGVLRQIASNGRSLVSVTAMTAGAVMLQRLLGPAEGEVALAGQLAMTIMLGASLYLGMHALLWLQAGRPDGPERQVVRAMTQLLRTRLVRAPTAKY